MRVEIKRLQGRLGVTSLYVTHDQVEAMTLADRLMVMNEGVAEQVGTPMEVYSHPASTFVAGFIGSPAMNFLGGRIGRNGSVELTDGGRLAVEPMRGSAGQSITVGVRPEHLTLRPQSGAGDRALDVTVELVEALGADTLVHCRLGADNGALLARLPGGVLVKPNDRLVLGVEPEAVHLFDPATGKVLATTTSQP
jgi:sn-glycerol 3-phosphate transport system ATP-binding protein